VRVAGLLWLACSSLASAEEPRTDASLAAGATRFSEFEDTGVAMTASVSRRVVGWLALEAQLGFSPSDLGRPPFSASRVEVFLGARAGSRLGPLRWFAAARPGFLRLAKAEEPFACILIYPPPLECTLQSGRTLPALQLGAGLEAHPGARALVRIEVGGLLLRYPGPAFTRNRETFDDALWSWNPRASVSLGVRF
jgi:hypothetical protein